MIDTDRLLGRDRELVRFEAAWRTVTVGRGRILLILGEPGIGKTRLADAFAALARERGSRVAWGATWDDAAAPPFAPWLLVLRAAARDMDPASRASALDAAGPHLETLLPELGVAAASETTHGNDDRARSLVLDSAIRFLRAAAVDRPLVVVLDDLHAADEISLQLLRAVAIDVGDAPILLIGTARDAELDPVDPRAALLADVQRLPTAETLHLRGLDEERIGLLIESTAGVTATPVLASAMRRDTGGNPLFVGEIVRLLQAEGTLDRATDLPAWRSVVPAGLGSVIARRLDRMPPSTQTAITGAAVLGNEFDIDLLAHMLGASAATVLGHLDAGVEARLVVPPTGVGMGWRFGHALIREVVYQRIPPSRRSRLHLAAGRSIEALRADRIEPYLATLAAQFRRALPAGDPGLVLDYTVRAAELAMRQYANAEAAASYEAALTLVPLGDSSARCELLLALGEAWSRAGRRDDAQAAFAEAADMAQRLDLPEARARAALGYGGRFAWFRAGPDRRIVPLLEGALEALPPGHDALRIRLLARLAGALRDDPDMRRRDALSAEAVAIARQNEETELHFALIARFTAIMGPDHVDEMAELNREATRVYRGISDFDRDGDSIWHRLILLLTLGDPVTDYMETLAAYRRAAEELHQPPVFWYLGIMETTLAIAEGRIADADPAIESNARLGRQATTWDAEYTRLIQRFAVRREQGRLTEMADDIERAIPTFAGYSLFRAVDAFIQASLGRTATARGRLTELVDGAHTIFGRDPGWLFAMGFLVETALLVDDRVRLRTVAGWLEPYRALVGTACGEVLADPVSRFLALAEEREGRIDDALASLDLASATAERSGARLHALRMEVDRARMLATRQRPGDVATARRILDSALDAAARSGLVAIHAAAEAVSTTLRQEGPSSASAETDPRSPRSDPPGRASSGPATFQHEGDVWSVAMPGDEPVRVRDRKGMHYLARLLSAPGREVHVRDLAASGVGGSSAADPARAAAAFEAGLHLDEADPGSTAIDATAREAYRHRMAELRLEVDAAEASGDVITAERATDELDAIRREVAAAYGLGDRARQVGSASERARQAVTKSIRLAIAQLVRSAPAVGRHLERTVRTGTYCVYDPDPAATPAWRT